MNMNYTKKELEKMIGSIGDNNQINKSVQFFNAKEIYIKSNARIDAFCIFIGPVIIGNYVHISPYTALLGGYGIEFEDLSGTAAGTIVYSGSDDYVNGYLIGPRVPDNYRQLSGAKVTFKKYSIAAARATIFPGVTLGVGSIAAACSLVTKDVPDFHIVGGIPAKFLKVRNSKKLLELEKNLFKELKMR